jgi:DNA mismatch repair protein MutS
MNILNFIKKKKKGKDIKDKKDEELSLDERLQLIQTNESSIQDIFSALIDLEFNNESQIVNVNERVYNDLEFFIDNDNSINNTIYNKINYTKTELGNNYLKFTLEKPIYNINLLNQRQNLLKQYIKLGDNNIKQINNSLNKINQIQNDIVWFWDTKNKKHIDVFKNIIFLNYTGVKKIDGFLNGKEILLSLNNIYKLYLAPIITVLTPLSAMILPIILFLIFRKKLPEQIRKFLTPKKFLSLIFNTFTNFFKSNIFRFFIKDPKKLKLLGYVTSAIWVLFYLQSIYSTINLSKTVNKIVNLIHSKMNSINTFIEETYKISSICKKLNLLSYYKIDGNLINKETDAIKNLLNVSILRQEPKLFNNKGRVLSKYYIFNDIKNRLINLMKYIGIIDLINSNNTLFHKNYNFTNFIDDNKPKIDCKAVWNPFIDKNSVTNDIKIQNNMIITGPNAAGKSTFIKSITINLLLSQTLGISASKKLEMTPFRLIDTYLHIPDVKGTASLFETEMLRSKEYIEKIKENDELSFVVMDELFSSTNYVEGFSGAFAILNKMSKYKKSLFIVTTHYTKLARLEKRTKGRIKNYKFEIDRDICNNIKFNYKLQKGFSEQYIALELLKNNDFDEDIINEAIKTSKTIKIVNKKSKKQSKKKTKKQY